MYFTMELKYLTMGIIAIVFGSIFPDVDLKFGKAYHRFWLYHSIVTSVFLWIISFGNPDLQMISALLGFSIGVHLACDTHVLKRKMVGFYTIKLWKNVLTGKMHGLNGVKSTIWLWANFWLSVALLLLTVWMVV